MYGLLGNRRKTKEGRRCISVSFISVSMNACMKRQNLSIDNWMNGRRNGCMYVYIHVCFDVVSMYVWIKTYREMRRQAKRLEVSGFRPSGIYNHLYSVGFG